MESQKVKLSDPRHLYPRPPFPKQGQDLPGTEQKMEPAADPVFCYQGSDRKSDAVPGGRSLRAGSAGQWRRAGTGMDAVISGHVPGRQGRRVR